MPNNYDLIRLVLISREQTSLFEIKNQLGKTFSRQEWLNSIFSQQIVFNHQSSSYYYIPHQNYLQSLPTIVGLVGRQSFASENAPPSEGFVEVERAAWHASIIVIDPTSHSDGQKLAFQVKGDVGTSLPVIRSLAKSINERTDEPYIIEANFIIDPTDFWHFEEENRGDITSLTFELNAPNMFGIREEIDREMSELRDNEKARKTTIKIQNRDGLKLDTDRVKQTVKYALEGGGEIKAKTKRKKSYNSNNKSKKIAVDKMLDIDNKSSLSQVYDFVSRIFGSKQ